MADDDIEPRPRRAGAAFDRLVANMVEGGTVAWLTLLTGSPDTASFAGGAAGPIAEEFSYAVRSILQKQDKKLHRMVLEASDGLDDPNELFARSFDTDGRAELVIRASEAAARSPHPTHLKFIARLFATGALAEDEATVDHALLAIAAVSELDIPHLRLIDVLRHPRRGWLETPQLRQSLRYSWSRDEIVSQSPGLTDALPALTAKLESLGLVEGDDQHRDSHGKMWSLTSFGRVCVTELKSVAAADAPTQGR